MQRIRTAGEVEFESALLETVEAPIYQRIAIEVGHLRALGFSYSRIAKILGVTGKTIAKAARWSPEN